MSSAAAIEHYVANPPYWGRSHPRDAPRVKELCGPTRKFDYERKLWATRCTDALRALVASKKWQPVGIDKGAYAPLMRTAAEHRARAEAEWKAREEARKAREEEERQRLAAAEAIREAKRKAREAQEAAAKAKRQKRQKREAEAQAAAAAAKPREDKKREDKKRDGVEPSEAEAAECARLGFTEQAVAFSETLNELGPRGSLSDEGRLLRYCLLTRDPDESVRELTREERARSWGGREVRWTLPEAASREYAKELNRKAAAAQGA